MIDDNSPPNTAYNFHRTVLSEEQLYLKGVELKFSRSLKYLTTQELRNLFRPTTLMSCYPSPTLLANFSKQLMICSSLWSVCDPWCLRHPWGDLVVPTGWKWWGRFMAFNSFCHILLEGSKRNSASSCSQGSTWFSFPGIQDETRESRRLQL